MKFIFILTCIFVSLSSIAATTTIHCEYPTWFYLEASRTQPDLLQQAEIVSCRPDFCQSEKRFLSVRGHKTATNRIEGFRFDFDVDSNNPSYLFIPLDAKKEILFNYKGNVKANCYLKNPSSPIQNF